MRPAPETLRAWRLLLETHSKVVPQLDHELRAAHGLRLDWYDVLLQLHEAGGRLRMFELADATLISRTDCTRIVDRMEAAGLVSRQSAGEDGRGVYAAITDTGSASLRQAAPTHLEGIQRLFATHVEPADALVISEALGGVVERFPSSQRR